MNSRHIVRWCLQLKGHKWRPFSFGKLDRAIFPKQGNIAFSLKVRSCLSIVRMNFRVVGLPASGTDSATAFGGYRTRPCRHSLRSRWNIHLRRCCGPAVHPFLLEHGRICIYYQAKASQTRQGIIPRCVTVRPVLDWRKTTHRLRLSPMGVLRLRGWFLELM